MARGIHKLTAKAVEKAGKPGLYADGGGLYLQVSQWQTKAWIFRFMRDRRDRKMGLGPFPDVTLAEARDKALECRRSLRDGVDPIDARRIEAVARRTANAKVMTFRQCAEAYIKAHKASWRSDKHRTQWTTSLDTYAYPVFGDVAVGEVDLGLVMKAIEPIWSTKTETASRLRGRIETVLDWAGARGLRSGENPARWKGHLQKLLPAPAKVAKVKHHAALPYAKLPAFMAELRADDGFGSRALEFAILTAARTSEAIAAEWSEIDLAARMWTVPGERMKSGREHRVPLSDRVIEILESLPREGEFVFIGTRKGKPPSTMALAMVLRRMKRTEITTHGFRSTFKDWASEQTAYPNEMSEIALAHVVTDKTEAAYRRGDMLEKRRRLMADWASYCASKPKAAGDNVVPMRGQL